MSNFTFTSDFRKDHAGEHSGLTPEVLGGFTSAFLAEVERQGLTPIGDVRVKKQTRVIGSHTAITLEVDIEPTDDGAETKKPARKARKEVDPE